MGFDSQAVRFLLETRREGIDLGETATLGRQGMHLSAAELRRAFQRMGAALDEAQAQTCLKLEAGRPCPYADEFLRLCGAKSVTAIDNSDYEGAECIHDLNQPLPADWTRTFDTVIDAGTLEHVFNFPVAVHNCMRLLRPGGRFLGITPCNNFMGHGLYQFSPELYWSLFSEANHFTVERLYVAEVRSDAPWYAAARPRDVEARVELCNRRPTYLLVRARKIQDPVPAVLQVQQSDYHAAWALGEFRDGGDASVPPNRGWRSVVRPLLPLWMLRSVRHLRRHFGSPFREPFFRRVS